MSTARRTARVATVVALVGATVPLGGLGTAAEPRTETGLGGYSLKAEGAPIRVLVDDPNAAIPRDTGVAAAEVDPNYTLATVATGPNAFGLASNAWPGNLVGTGLPAIDPRIPQYPAKVEARYPDGPYEGVSPDGGVATSSVATGLDASATADGSPTNKPGPLTVGDAFSHSSASVTSKNVAVATVTSSVKDVSLLGGVIKIASVTTKVTTTSDGTKPTTTGSTVVSGLSVNGVGYSVDENGARVGGNGLPVPPLVTPSQLDELGIRIEGVVQSSSTTATSASRSASGLVIRIDTKVFRAALTPVIDPLRDPYSQVVESLPSGEPFSQAKPQLYYLLNATPNVTYVFGAANARSAAVLPISFDFPPPSFPSFPSNPGVVGAPPTLPRGEGGFVSGLPDRGTALPPSIGGAPVSPPVLQPPGTTPVALASDAEFTGIAASKLLLALLFAGGVGWLLTRLLGAAGGLPFGLGCRLGAPTTVPDFRSVTA